MKEDLDKLKSISLPIYNALLSIYVVRNYYGLYDALKAITCYENTEMNLRRLCSLLKFQLEGYAGIGKIKIRTENFLSIEEIEIPVAEANAYEMTQFFQLNDKDVKDVKKELDKLNEVISFVKLMKNEEIHKKA